MDFISNELQAEIDRAATLRSEAEKSRLYRNAVAKRARDDDADAAAANRSVAALQLGDDDDVIRAYQNIGVNNLRPTILNARVFLLSNSDRICAYICPRSGMRCKGDRNLRNVANMVCDADPDVVMKYCTRHYAALNEDVDRKAFQLDRMADIVEQRNVLRSPQVAVSQILRDLEVPSSPKGLPETMVANYRRNLLAAQEEIERLRLRSSPSPISDASTD